MPSGRKQVIAIPFLHTAQEVVSTGDVSQIVAGAPRQMYIAEIDPDTKRALTSDFIEVPQLVAGDVAPTAEPSYEDFTFFDGTRAQVRNGDTYPTKTWPLKLPDTHPVMVKLFKYEDSDGNTNPEKGRFLAYNSFNPDRGGSKGEFKVNSINPAGEGTHAYNVVVAYKSKIRIPSAQNPAVIGGGEPTFASMTPTTGPVGQTVLIEGANLAGITAITVGAETVDADQFSAQSGVNIVFDIPAGLTAGAQAVELLYGEDGEVSAGSFTVTA